jgi:hypothetical protein
MPDDPNVDAAQRVIAESRFIRSQCERTRERARTEREDSGRFVAQAREELERASTLLRVRGIPHRG